MAGRSSPEITDPPRRGRSLDVAIPVAPAVVTWVVGWLTANLLAIPAILLITGSDPTDLEPLASLVALVTQWAVLIVALVVVSRQFGTGSVLADLGARFRPVDLLGLPVGVVIQAIVVPLAYWPLRQMWPDTFSPEAVEERSRALIDGAGGIVLTLLAVGAVIGAPVVEELVYRGLLQRSISRRLGGVGAWVLTSILFAAVHFSAVDFLGLLIAGLVFGAGVLVTGRIGFGVWAHIGFNAFAMTVLIATT